MRILVLTSEVPFPPDTGGLVRTYQVLKRLALRHDVTCVSFAVDDRTIAPPIPLEMIAIPWTDPPLYSAMKSTDSSVATRAYEFLQEESREPWFVSCYDVSAMNDAVRDLARRPFDLILVEHTFMGRFLSAFPPTTPTILDMHNVHSLMAIRDAEMCSTTDREQSYREAQRTVAFERSIADRCNMCLTCSEMEAGAVRRLLGVDTVEVLPNGVDCGYFYPSHERPQKGKLLFTGAMNYAPNIEAAVYFANEVFPLIRRDLPGVKFHIAGKNPTDEVLALASDTVIVHGAVPDMRRHFARAEIVVVPLLRGGGTRLKILEAAASGKTIVTTSLGMEGLDFRPGSDLIVGDSPEAFANEVVRLSREPARRRALERRSRLAALPYDWDAVIPQLDQVVQTVAQTMVQV